MSLVNFADKAATKGKVRKLRAVDKEEYATIRAHSMGKGARPWELVPVTKNLDPDDVWIGVEWETGFPSLETYRQVLDYTWATYHFVTVDAEGVGPFFGEYTFAPTNGADFFGGTSPFDGVRQYMREQGIAVPTTFKDIQFPDLDSEFMRSLRGTYRHSNYLVSNWDWAGGQDMRKGSGIHVNISTPTQRRSSIRIEKICTAMNKYLSQLSSAQARELFGREPYGFAFARSSEEGGRLTWLEFKLFQTTDDDDLITAYKKVVKRLGMLIDYIVQSYDVISDAVPSHDGTEIYHFLSGRVMPRSSVPMRVGSYADGHDFELGESHVDDDDDDDRCSCGCCDDDDDE